MLFNSYGFIFIFLPVTLGVFFVLGARSRTWGLRWLIAASLFFYAWWRPVNVLILAPSLAINFVIARRLRHLVGENRRGPAKTLLAIGIVFNIAFLGYFKYANFAVESVNDALGTEFQLARIILPLGVSFITFQKIAFLVDVYAGRVQTFTLHDYSLFVLFFPQLIAGPIVHYRELMPQFQRARCRLNLEDLAVGVTLFVFGLFKKVYLADAIAPAVSSLFDQAAAGKTMMLLPAWLAAAGFTLQIYFDFSGYTDMALGIARCFGIQLPPNFNSPLQASSVIEFWARWHMTLTRFLTAYIYNPIALTLTRRRMGRGLPVAGGRGTTVGAFLELTTFPLMITMFVSGLWHGAGYLFILWGLLHGVYLTINHGWRLAAPHLWKDRKSYERFMRPAGLILTLASVAVSMVLFRAPTIDAALGLLQGLAGGNGVRMEVGAAMAYRSLTVWIFSLGVVAIALPNTLQILSAYRPALDWKPSSCYRRTIELLTDWQPSPIWAALIATVAALGVLSLGSHSEFLYWQF